MITKVKSGRNVARFIVDVNFREGVSISNEKALEELSMFISGNKNNLRAFTDKLFISDLQNDVKLVQPANKIIFDRKEE